MTRPTGNVHANIVLLHLANHANTRNVAWPTIALLGEATDLSRASVKRALRILRDGGYIKVTEAPEAMGKGVTWQVMVEPVEPKNPAPSRGSNGPPKERQRGSNRAGRGVYPNPKPIIEPISPLTPRSAVTDGDRHGRFWIGEHDPAFEAWRKDWHDRLRKPGPPKDWHPTLNEQGIWRATRLPPAIDPEA